MISEKVFQEDKYYLKSIIEALDLHCLYVILVNFELFPTLSGC